MAKVRPHDLPLVDDPRGAAFIHAGGTARSAAFGVKAWNAEQGAKRQMRRITGAHPASWRRAVRRIWRWAVECSARVEAPNRADPKRSYGCPIHARIIAHPPPLPTRTVRRIWRHDHRHNQDVARQIRRTCVVDLQPCSPDQTTNVPIQIQNIPIQFKDVPIQITHIPTQITHASTQIIHVSIKITYIPIQTKDSPIKIMDSSIQIKDMHKEMWHRWR